MKVKRNNIKSSVHNTIRNIFRILGPLMIITGVLFIIIGLNSIFGSYKEEVKFTLPNGEVTTVQVDISKFSNERYEKIWCIFVGFPFILLGISATRFAYMGDIARYEAAELTPVGKDVVNYMVDNTRDAVKDVGRSIAVGISDGLEDIKLESQQNIIMCHKCKSENKASAKFCNKCGIELCKSKSCPKCTTLNDGNAKFCDECGYSF